MNPRSPMLEERALSLLSPMERRVLVRLIVDRISVNEIASDEGCTPSFIDQLIVGSRRNLHAIGIELKTPDMEYGPFFSPTVSYMPNEELDLRPCRQIL